MGRSRGTVLIVVAALLASALTTAAASAAVQTPDAADAASGPAAPSLRCRPVLDEPAAGTAALDALGVRLPEVASRNRQSTAELRALLRHDRTLHVDRCGALYYVDELHRDGDVATERTADVPDAIVPLDQTFQLRSRPGSNRTIYLDFDGHTLTGTAWNEQQGLPPGYVLAPFSLDGTVSTDFSDDELKVIQATWQKVAEDYAPFDVDVTTRDPGQAAITRNGIADDVYGTRAVITNADPSPFCSSCSGIAYLDVFDEPNFHAIAQPALVFSSTIFTGEPLELAATISHEVGHNLALNHHGGPDFNGWVSEYSPGQGMWMPLMGSGIYPLSTWSDGAYRQATNTTQDDVATIAARGAPLMPDDHGDTVATATSIASTPATRTGLIHRRTDVDWFTFTTGGGPTVVTATPAPVGPNLDLSLQLRAADGATVIETQDPPSSWEYFNQGWFAGFDRPVRGLDATMSRDLAPGTYHVRVDGVGAGNPHLDGYSDYGSLGRYTLSISAPGVPPPPPPPAPQVTIGAGGPTGRVNTTSATFSFTSSITPATFQCSLNAGPWTACSSPRNVTTTTQGSQSFEVRATAAGVTGVPATRTWTVDTVAPVVTITGTPAQGASTSSGTADLRWSANEDVQRFECRLTIAGEVRDWRSDCGSGVGFSGLPPGDHRVDVRTRDLAGNLGSAARSWRVTGGGTTPPPSGGAFADVPRGSTHEANIYELAARGVTLGCGGSNFCPRDLVTREQMATFLVRALQLPPGSTSPPFSDVTPGSTHAANIDAMRRESITLGCGGSRFCPRADVPREQMASFLQRALGLPPGSTSPPFSDVRAGSTHARAIDAVRIEGITVGCGGSRFCPTDGVTREQMATFLVRALGW